MAYKLDTVAKTVDCLNRTYFLPAIQREFVWNQEQISMTRLAWATVDIGRGENKG